MASVRRTLFAIAFVIGANLVAPHARAAVDAAWFPLVGGAEWSYDVHRDLTLEPERTALSRMFYTGRASWVAEPARGHGPTAFVVQQTTVEVPAEGSRGGKLAVVESTVYSFASELRVLARTETTEGGVPSETAFKPPLRILPTTTVGESWDAGTFRQGEQQAALRGKVLGIEDLKGEPGYSGCL